MVEHIIKNEAMRSLLEGLMLIVGVLALMAYVSSSANYSLNYSVIPESNTLTLQQGTNYKLNLYFKLDSQENLPFTFRVYSPEGISLNMPANYNSYRDFSFPILIEVSNIVEPKEYTINIVSSVIYGGMVNEKVLPLTIKVISKEEIVFQTTNYTNEYPKLVLLDLSTRNLLMDKNSSQDVVFKFKNLGSDTIFFMNEIINSTDKNKINIEYNQKYFILKQNEEKNIIVKITLNEDYNVEYSQIYFYAQEQTTKQQLDLKQINITLKTKNILFEYNKDSNNLILTNIGTDIVKLDINTNKREYNLLLMPNQKYTLNVNEDENYAKVFLNGQLLKELKFEKGIVDEKKSVNFSAFTGLFSFADSSTTWIIFGIVLVLLLLLIRKLFFSRKSVFGKNVYITDLKTK